MRRLDELLLAEEEAPVPADRFALAVLDPGFNALHIAMLQAIAGSGGGNHGGPTPSEALRPLERKAVYLGPAALSKPERRSLLEQPGTMARLHLAAWLHWRSERGLPWEKDEPLPPAPRRPLRRSRPPGAVSAAA
jgi:hypothetical protein